MMKYIGVILVAVACGVASFPAIAYAADDATKAQDVISALLILAVLIVLYFIPTMVASSRCHASTAAIAALNLFLGWTFIGWVLSLVWALTANTVPPDNRPANKRESSRSSDPDNPWYD